MKHYILLIISNTYLSANSCWTEPVARNQKWFNSCICTGMVRCRRVGPSSTHRSNSCFSSSKSVYYHYHGIICLEISVVPENSPSLALSYNSASASITHYAPVSPHCLSVYSAVRLLAAHIATINASISPLV